MCATISGLSVLHTSSKSATRIRGTSEGLMRRNPPSKRVRRFMSFPTSKELQSLASGGALYLSSVLINLFMAMNAGFSRMEVCPCSSQCANNIGKHHCASCLIGIFGEADIAISSVRSDKLSASISSCGNGTSKSGGLRASCMATLMRDDTFFGLE